MGLSFDGTNVHSNVWYSSQTPHLSSSIKTEYSSSKRNLFRGQTRCSMRKITNQKSQKTVMPAQNQLWKYTQSETAYCTSCSAGVGFLVCSKLGLNGSRKSSRKCKSSFYFQDVLPRTSKTCPFRVSYEVVSVRNVHSSYIFKTKSNIY